MSDEEYEALQRDLTDGHQNALSIYQRMRDHQARWASWQEAHEKALEAGEPVPPLSQDETHKALAAELKYNLDDLQTHLNRPRIDSATRRQMLQQLSPEQRAQLREQMVERLQSSPPELRDEVS